MKAPKRIQHGQTQVYRSGLMEQGKSFCSHCRKIKPVKEFSKNKRRPLGIADNCLVCAREAWHASMRRKRYNRAVNQGEI